MTKDMKVQTVAITASIIYMGKLMVYAFRNSAYIATVEELHSLVKLATDIVERVEFEVRSREYEG